MISIGLTGWRDHPLLHSQGIASHARLREYSSHFPIVEVDASFYAIQPQKNYQKWVEETPPTFSFVVKAYQEMTGHTRGKASFESMGAMFQAYKESLQPILTSGKLLAVLFQYPPWFECNQHNVEILRYTRETMREIPIALEFRNQSWFSPQMKDKTLAFMEKEGWIHSICDEPQTAVGSVPIVLHATNDEITLVRFHGRNRYAWENRGQANWRETRYLYRYNQQELLEWKERLLYLQKESKRIGVLFNNNSGGDAAHNAKQLIQILGIEYEGLAPRQLEFF